MRGVPRLTDDSEHQLTDKSHSMTAILPTETFIFCTVHFSGLWTNAAEITDKTIQHLVSVVPLTMP